MPSVDKPIIRKIFVVPFLIYKKIISPLLPGACLYQPSCSEYFSISILRFGLVKGFFLGLTRILRCNGWFFAGGDDPVPEIFDVRHIANSYKKYFRFGKSN